MKKHVALTLLSMAALIFAVISCDSNAVADNYATFRQEKFVNPDNTFRSIPFYSINDSISKDELVRQLGLFKDGGFGGAFLHSRIGLLTPYLSDEWFEIMDVGLKACQDLGIEAWYYDEDKWPSGFAGGIVPEQSVDFRARALARVDKSFVVEEPDRLLWEDDTYKYVSVVDTYGQSWYNGTCWVDLMNSDMVKAFIDCSYQPYVDKYAGKPLSMGIFTDEPQISPKAGHVNGAKVAYSPVIDSTFRNMWGYELAPHIPELFVNQGDYRTVRLHYYRTVAYCMEMAFSKQLGDYCGNNGFIFTGHYNGEDNPSATMLNEGNLMQQLRHMQQPGCDALGLGFRDAHNGKVVSSVANQYGQKRRLSEIYGISGHNMSFEDRMWLASWHTIVGINFLCPHLSLYSMKGERKRDYPPTLSYQQPYWPDNKLFEDFSARLCYFATVGKSAGEVCILTPIESDYINVDPIISDRWAYDTPFEGLMQKLFACHVNFDIGDEQIISEIGRVADGRFEIGQMKYKVVILPRMLTIRPSTVALLKEFAAAGGKVLVADSYPRYIEGVEDSAQLEALKNASTLFSSADLSKVLGKSLDRDFTVSGDHSDEVWSHWREVEGGYALQLSNTSRTAGRRISIAFADGITDIMLWNPVNGQALSIAPQADGSYMLDFAPAQTWIITCGEPSLAAVMDDRYSPRSESVTLAAIEGAWKGHRNDLNALPLDFMQWSINDGKSWSKPEPPLAVWDRFSAATDKYNGPMLLKYHFKVDVLPAVCSLAVEQPWLYSSIAVNGKNVGFGNEYYVDHIIRTGNIADKIVVGENEIVMALDFKSPIPASFNAIERYGTEIENIYVVGDFAVKGSLASVQPTTSERNQAARLAPTAPPAEYEYGSFVITSENAEFTGNITTAGYPFYAGGFDFTNTFEVADIEKDATYKLRFSDAEAILVKVEVNGQKLPTVFSSPWEVDVTPVIKVGGNDVKVTLVGSLRNLMGPSHNRVGEMNKVGPSTFRGQGSWPEVVPGDSNWYDVRLTGKAKSWRDNYFCIPFGMLGPVELVKE